MKKLVILLCVVAMFCCIACCSAVENTSGVAESMVSDSESKPETHHKFEITEISETEKRVKFYRDDLMIYGVLYLPEGEGPFPITILSPGMQCPYYMNESYAEELARNGIAGLAFEFTGTNNKSDGSFAESSILTHAADLNVVIDAMASLLEIDSSNLFLWGHSLGGLTSTYVAAQRPDDIKAMVLLEPSLHMPDMFRGNSDQPVPGNQHDMQFGEKFIEDIAQVDIFGMMPNFDKEVLMLKGTEDPSGQEEAHAQFISVLVKGADTFPNAQLVTVEGADHHFYGIHGNAMIRQTIEFLKENMD